MITSKIYSESDFEPMLDFCRGQSGDSSLAAKNMWADDWQNLPHTLPYILANKTRFYAEKGQFYLLYDYGDIVGCGGIYISDFSPTVAIAGSRTWLAPEYRQKEYVRDFLLPMQRTWAIERNMDIVALTFNQYNKNLRKLFARGQRIKIRQPYHMFFKNYNELDFLVVVQSVPQWLVYERLAETDFNWDIIRYSDK